MPDGRRAFMMGNALVVGVVDEIGATLGGAERREVPYGIFAGHARNSISTG